MIRFLYVKTLVNGFEWVMVMLSWIVSCDDYSSVSMGILAGEGVSFDIVRNFCKRQKLKFRALEKCVAIFRHNKLFD